MTGKLTILFAGLALFANPIIAQDININAPALKLQYDFPAKDWESEALPIGNGFIGAMLFGDVLVDVIQINEHSLWSGGPGAHSDYNGGHTGTAQQNHQALQNLRNALQEKMTAFSNNNAAYRDATGEVVAKDYAPENDQLRDYIQTLMGKRIHFGSYQSLGNINIACVGDIASENANDDQFPAYTNYLRELDIDNAIATLTYTMEGVNYKREYFISYPDNILVVRLTADRPGMLSSTFFLTTPQPKAVISAANDVITMEGQPADH